MPNDFELNVRFSFINTLQAFRFANSALIIFRQVDTFGLSPNPIKIQRYGEALDDLMQALDLFPALLPTDPVLPTDPIIPTDPVFPPNVSNEILIRQAQNRTTMAISRVTEAIRYLRAAQPLNPAPDIPLIIDIIEENQVAARSELFQAFNLPSYASET